MHIQNLRNATLLFAGLMVSACAGESVTEGSTPEIQSRELAQLSAGGGIAGYDFYVEVGGLPTRVGTLIVTNGAFNAGAGYYDQMEYWRWDSTSLADIETGSVSLIDVDFVGSSTSYSSTLVGNFESGTSSWTAWDVNRLFDLQSTLSVEWNNPAGGEVLYTMEADAWAGVAGTITYFLKMEFDGVSAYPEMVWYIDWADYTRWVNSEAYDGDSDGIYEVRLTDDSEMSLTTYGIGYELKTVK